MNLIKKWSRWFCAIVALGSIAAAHASVDFLLQLDDIKGELVDATHPGAVEVAAWSFGATNPTAVSATGGNVATKVAFTPLTLRKRIDKASPLLMDACASGKHFNRATLTLRRRTATEVEFVHLVLEDVTVDGILIGLLRDADVTTETISLNFARVGIEYFTIVNDKPVDRYALTWDVVQNIQGNVSFPSGDPNWDGDGDGLPDGWENMFGVHDPRADDDGDGATNFEEYVAGTSPVDKNQVFKSTLTFSPTAPNAVLTWLSAPGKTYNVMVTDTLGGQYQTLTTVNASSDGTTSITLPKASVNQFFRVQVAQ